MEFLSLTSLVFALTIVANIAIAAFVYANNPKYATNRVFFALCASLSLWLTAMLATSIPAFDPWYLALARLTLVFATPMNVLFFLFALTVPDDKIGLGRKGRSVLFAAAGIVAAVVASPLAFQGLNWFAGRPEPIPGPALPLFGLFSIGLNIAAVVAMFVKTRRAKGERRLQLRLVLLGILLMFGLIFGTIFVPVLLLGDPSFVPLAPMYVLLFTGLTGYAIFRRKLLDVKVVAAEIFSATLMLIVAVQLFLARSFLDLGFRVVVFAFVGIFIVQLIQSVRAEVRRRDELQTLSAKLTEANAHLQELDKLKSEFVSIASHQLRTPISIIKGYLALFLEGAYGEISPAAKEKLTQMFVINERMVRMVNNMLSVSRIEANRIEFACVSFDLMPVLRTAVKEMEEKAKLQGMTISLVERQPLSVYCDPAKLSEVLLNLLDNAVKYSDRGTVEVQARIRPRKGAAVVTVKDQGSGMSEEQMRHLFEKFYRAKGPLIAHTSGTGLGLYVCAKFMRAMGGEIWVERTGPGKGTTFAIAIPLRKGVVCQVPV